MKAATTARRPTSGHQRRNFSLRPDTARLLDRLHREVNRSQLVDAAIQRLVKDRGRAQLQKLIAEEATANAARDLHLVEEWFAVDAEGWPRATADSLRPLSCSPTSFVRLTASGSFVALAHSSRTRCAAWIGRSPSASVSFNSDAKAHLRNRKRPTFLKWREG